MHPLRIRLHSSARSVQFVLLFALALVINLRAATYYVDYAGGSDTNPGTAPTAAWKHCPGDPTASANAAATALAPGDTVLFKGGVTYVLGGSTGIILRWNGTPGLPITYDGNSSGQWGVGRAILSDHYGSNGLAAFSVAGAAAQLVFRNLEFSALGGAATLPADAGSPVAPRYGAGLALPGGATEIRIDGCVFREIGYAYNQKPMNAAAIAGTGISLGNTTGVVIAGCEFSRLAVAIDLQKAATVSRLEISRCRFGDAVLWSINGPVTATAQAIIAGCTESNTGYFGRGAWTGYGESPRTSVKTVTAGVTVTLAATAAATPTATFQWRKNGTAMAGATAATLTLNAVTSADAASYTAVATNSAGTATSHEAVLIVNTPTVVTEPVPTSILPAITLHPASQTVAANASVTFNAAASGSPAPTFQWTKNGVALAGATGASLSLTGVTSTHAGNYALVATNVAGKATSNSAVLTVLVPTNIAPVITAQPVGCTVLSKTTVTLNVAASGTPAPGFQWYKDGAAIAGATSATLMLRNVNKGAAGSYIAVATNIAGTATSQPAVLVVDTGTAKRGASTALDPAEPAAVNPPPRSRLVNLSVRSATGAGGDALIVGFVVAGDARKSVLVRGVGPTLERFGVSAPIRDPQLALYAGVNLVDGNDDWNTAANAPAIAAAAEQVGAFTLPTPGADAALLADLAPGAYTTRVTGLDGAAGSALVEVYDATPTSTARLINVSVRTLLTAAGDPTVIGFVISGDEPKTLLIRAAGPALRAFGVDGALADPQLEIYAGSSALQRNDDWSGQGELSAAFAASGAFAFADSTSKDAALVFRAAPGAYTAVVSSADQTDGIVLVEVYELSAP